MHSDKRRTTRYSRGSVFSAMSDEAQLTGYCAEAEESEHSGVSKHSRVAIEDATNAEIASAIHYLDPEYPDRDPSGDRGDPVLMMCLSLILLFGGTVGFIVLYLRAS